MEHSQVLQTAGEILEENLGRSTENLELALGFKERKGLDKYGEEEKLQLGEARACMKSSNTQRNTVVDCPF